MNRSSNAPPCRIPLTPQFDSGVDRDHRRQVGRVHLGQGVLGAAGIARAEGADLAVGPGLRGDPLDDVVAVLRVVGHQPPGPLAGVPAADVVGDHDVAALGVVLALGRRRRSCCRACGSGASGTGPRPACRPGRAGRCRRRAGRRRASGSSTFFSTDDAVLGQARPGDGGPQGSGPRREPDRTAYESECAGHDSTRGDVSIGGSLHESGAGMQGDRPLGRRPIV